MESGYFCRLRSLFFKRKKRCHSKKIPIKVFLDETPEEEKSELLDHIFSCSKCYDEFIHLKEVWLKGGQILDGREEQNLSRRDALRLKKLATQEIRAIKPPGHSRPGLLSHPKRLAAAAVTIIVIVSVALFVQFGRLDRSGLERRINETTFSVIAPWGKTSEPVLKFRWEPQSRAEHYTLEILDIALDSIFKKDGIETTEYVLPERVYDSLLEGKTYFWKVTAVLENRQEIESEFAKFIIKKH
jgi:hypothetical protein